MTDVGDPPDDLVELETDEAGEREQDEVIAQPEGSTRLARMTAQLSQATQRKRRTQPNPQEVKRPKIARVDTTPAFPFEDAYEEYQ